MDVRSIVVFEAVNPVGSIHPVKFHSLFTSPKTSVHDGFCRSRCVPEKPTFNLRLLSALRLALDHRVEPMLIPTISSPLWLFDAVILQGLPKWPSVNGGFKQLSHL